MKSTSSSTFQHNMYKFGAWLPFTSMLLIIFVLYGMYMWTYLIPLIQGTNFEAPISLVKLVQMSYFTQFVSWNDRVFLQVQSITHFQSTKGIIIIIIIHPLLIFLLIAIWRVVTTEAGRIPHVWLQQINEEIHLFIQNENMIINECKLQRKENHDKKANSTPQSSIHSSQPTQCEFDKNQEHSQVESSIISELDEDLKSELNIRAKLELIDKQGRRFCKNCTAFKPERAHHCRQCKNCWQKMDHHCQWLNNCIGKNNYKLFINLIVYAQLLLLVMTFSYTRCYYDAMQRKYLADWELFAIAFNYFFSIMLFLLLSGFVSFHFWFQNIYIQRIISINRTTLEYCEGKKLEEVQNQSIYSNFVQVFGSNPLVWFIPILPTENKQQI